MKRAIATAVISGIVVFAFGLASYQGLFNSTYKISKDSELGKAKCGACHAKMTGGALNPYGKDLDAAVKKSGGKKVTADVLKAVEGLDSDKDGVKNIDELKAGKNPGVK